MASLSRPPNARPSDAPPDPALLTVTIDRLRAEYDAQQDATLGAMLLHELAVLEESSGDEAAAARDLLSAVNVEPTFREPLERLIAIIQRRQSHKNLGKLLERLVNVAETPEEQARAALRHAAFSSDHQDDPDAATSILTELTSEQPGVGAAWLALELLAGGAADDDTRRRALEARTGLTEDPIWRALLLVDLARLQLTADDVDGAIRSLQTAIDAKGPATFRALLALEVVGSTANRADVVARALEVQSELVLRAIDDETTGNTYGVPYYQRSSAHAADAWLRAAEAHRARGDLSAASALLDKALARLPDETALRVARMRASEAAGDTAAAARLAREELDRGAKGPVAAALWMRVAEAAAADGDGPAALEALDKGLAENPGCIPARALELDLLGSGDAATLASALEAAAGELETDAAKARFFLWAADAWARGVRDVQGAKAALSQAGMYGTPAATLARVGRMLAAILGETAWYEDSTRRLLAAGAAEDEQRALWLELGRARLLRGDLDGAREAFAALSRSPGGAWLGPVLTAYGLELAAPADAAAPPDGSAAIRTIAEAEDDPDARRALEIVASLRADRAGDSDAAASMLESLVERDPSDVVTATALAAKHRQSDPKRAAEVLAACAATTDDAELAASLLLEAGLLRWQASDREGAVEVFEAASEHSADAADAILGWALRATDPDSVDARRNALAAAGSGDPASRLERFGLEVGPGGDPTEAEQALDAVSSGDDDVARAALLGRALWSATDDPLRTTEALDRLGAASDAARGLAAGAAFRRVAESADTNDPDVLEAAAERWAATDPSLVAALEWLGAATATGDVDREVRARRAVADRLDGSARAAMHASASLLAALSGDDHQPLLAGDDVTTSLTNLDLSPAGADPRRRAAALVAAADAEAVEDDATAHALAGWNHLAADDAGRALACFRKFTETHPEEMAGWDGVRLAGEALGDRAAVAEACAALGDAVADDARGGELWEQAAFILLDELNDAERGEYALGRAVERDVGRFEPFDRLFRIVRERKDGPRLLELIDRRLEVADDPDEIAKMFWERARVLRGAGDRQGALDALENVTMLEPDHVGALALSGEIHLTEGQLPEAATNLARLATLDDAPQKQRLMSGVAAADIYEKKLDDLPKAVEVLQSLYAAGLSTVPVRERLAAIAAKAEDWDAAIAVLEELMRERDTSEGRIEAARLAIAIHRDRRGEPAAAAGAVSKLLEEQPADGEGVDLVLEGILPGPDTARLLRQSRRAVVDAVQGAPLDVEQVNRLARIATTVEDPSLRQATLGALVALGHGSPDVDAELARLDQRVAATPQIAIDERAVPDLCDPADAGAIPELMRAIAPTLAETLGPGLEALGVGKRDRVKPTAGLPIRNEIAAWAGALGVGDFELYVGGRDPDGVFGVATDPVSIVVGSNVAAPLSPAARQLLARELFALRRGTSILRHRDPTDIAALVVAVCKIGGSAIQSPAYAMLGEFERLIGKGLPRRARKALPPMTQAVAAAGRDPIDWVRAATASLDRMAAVAAGDVSWVLAAGSRTPRGQIGASNEARARAERLLRFVLSPTYLSLREQLGMGVR